MVDVVMPRLSDTMEEGELSKWLKNVGDAVEKGDVLAEIETDKATMDLEAFDSGILEKQLVEAGTVVPIGTPVAVIGDGSGANEAPAKAPRAKAPRATAGEKPGAKEDAAAQQSTPDGDRDPEPLDEEATRRPGRSSAPSSQQSEEMGSAHSSRARMSPLARKIAKDHGLDPATIIGSGPQGRVIRADVEAAIASSPPAGAPARRDAGETVRDDEVVPVNRIRKVAAKRLTESQAVPHFFLTSVVAVEKLLDFRTELNESLESHGTKVSVNDLFVRAAAVTLRRHPEANSSWNDDSLIRHARVNIGIAVATDAGLLVPVVHDADTKDLGSIARETVALAGKARDGKLSPDEMSGGTFSISNLGMFGIDQFTAVINPPEAAILAVGAAVPVPMLRDGHLVEVPKLKITLTVDHRVMDGAVAAGFLRDLVAALEHPLRLIV
ncbi:MAG: 2-oxo acid dehydrogenase subunit E2 [Cryobacterium sp.]|nr:2-oxo acid dehydrogenase subunit E2 [Cryobacterium sp.]